MFAYLAGITERIEFATGVLILPQRQTVLVAKQAADLDLLSGGRLRLGVGVGWNYVEYDALGQDFRTRGRRADEQIRFLRQLWTNQVSSFDGEFDRLDRGVVVPGPNRQIPIWVGGFSPAAFRAGRGVGRRVHVRRRRGAGARSRRTGSCARRRAGRDLAGFGLDYVAVRAATPDVVIAEAERWREVGGDPLLRGVDGCRP